MYIIYVIPGMVWFMDENLRPALICIYLLLNYCTLFRMMSVDHDGFVRTIWGSHWKKQDFEIRLKLEKPGAALFLAVSTWLFSILGFLVRL